MYVFVFGNLSREGREVVVDFDLRFVYGGYAPSAHVTDGPSKYTSLLNIKYGGLNGSGHVPLHSYSVAATGECDSSTNR